VLEAVLPRLVERQELVAYLVTEPSAGSDVGAIRTSAGARRARTGCQRDEVFATNGAVANVYSVLARTSPAAGARGCPSSSWSGDAAPGFKVGKIEHKLGMRAPTPRR